MIKSDSQTVNRTKRIIFDSFYMLLETKDFAKITVADILETAQICKGTFYNHFLDKFDLANKAVEAFTNDYEAFLNAVNMTIEGSVAAPLVCNFMNRHRIQYNALVKIRDRDIDFSKSLHEVLLRHYSLHRCAHSENKKLESIQFAHQQLMILEYVMSLDHFCCPADIMQVNKAIYAVSANLLRRDLSLNDTRAAG